MSRAGCHRDTGLRTAPSTHDVSRAQPVHTDILMPSNPSTASLRVVFPDAATLPRGLAFAAGLPDIPNLLPTPHAAWASNDAQARLAHTLAGRVSARLH